MSYLYKEVTTEEHSSLAAHLAVCPDCKAKVGDWRSALSCLDAWQVPSKRPAIAPSRVMVRWAAAAAILLGAGFGIGRLASATVTAERVRAEIGPKIRQELRQEFARMLGDELNRTAAATLAAAGEQTKQVLTEYAKAFETGRVEDNRAFYAALEKLESQRITDLLSLKKDVDTVAVLTDAGLRQLASYTQPANFSNSPQN